MRLVLRGLERIICFLEKVGGKKKNKKTKTFWLPTGVNPCRRRAAQGEAALSALNSLELLTGSTCSANLPTPCCTILLAVHVFCFF